jgi:hypothetical protein
MMDEYYYFDWLPSFMNIGGESKDEVTAPHPPSIIRLLDDVNTVFSANLSRFACWFYHCAHIGTLL